MHSFDELSEFPNGLKAFQEALFGFAETYRQSGIVLSCWSVVWSQLPSSKILLKNEILFDFLLEGKSRVKERSAKI